MAGAKRQNNSVVSAIVNSAKVESFDEDRVLIDRFLSGEAEAFERLYTRYYDKVFSVARGVLMDADEAADAVQEIFTLVYKNLGRFDNRARFSTWLFRIAVNRSIQQARANRHRNRQSPLNDAITQEADPVEVDSDPKVEAALAELSASDRAILSLFYWEELSLNEIAESMGCSPNAAKTRLYRARERFREKYDALEDRP